MATHIRSTSMCIQVIFSDTGVVTFFISDHENVMTGQIIYSN